MPWREMVEKNQIESLRGSQPTVAEGVMSQGMSESLEGENKALSTSNGTSVKQSRGTEIS